MVTDPLAEPGAEHAPFFCIHGASRLRNVVMRKRIAIVGAGVSGLVCARLLATRHRVTLFEADSHLGGHARTVEFEAYGQSYAADVGFMVFNDRTLRAAAESRPA